MRNAPRGRAARWIGAVAVVLLAGTAAADDYLAPYGFRAPDVRRVDVTEVAAEPESGMLHVTSQVLVSLEPGRKREDLEADLAQAAVPASVVGEIPDFGIVQLRVAAVDPTLLRRLRGLPAVRAAARNYVSVTSDFDDPLFLDPAQSWSIRRIQAPEAWAAANTFGAPITVAVVDSGCDPTHADLVDRYAALHSFRPRTVPGASPGTHGTKVAGILAATGGNGKGLVGVAPLCRVLDIQALFVQDIPDERGEIRRGEFITDADTIAGISWAIGRGAQVVNLSVAPEYPTKVQAALDRPNDRAGQLLTLLRHRDESLAMLDLALATARSRGVIVVVAAGNNDRPADWCPLPHSANTISVAAVDDADLPARFASPPLRSATNVEDPEDPETAVDLCAPGLRVHTCLMGGTYGPFAGTSAAAPHVAGVVALLKSVAPSARFETVREVLTSTADSTPRAASVGNRVNALRAVREMIRRRDGDEPVPATRPKPAEGPLFGPTFLWAPDVASIDRVLGSRGPDSTRIRAVVRYDLDRYLREAVPPEGGFYDEYGRRVQYPDHVALGPPSDLAGRDRFQYAWDHRAEVRSRTGATLEAIVLSQAIQAVTDSQR